MTNDELKKIIEKHERWLKNQEGGECADLHGTDLHGTDLRYVNLSGANLRNVNLGGANLRGANLCDSDLRYSDLHGVELYDASLCYADIRYANLRDANLCCTNLQDANLFNTDLHGVTMHCADIYNTNLWDADLQDAKNVPYIPMTCPDSGSFIAWKKARGYIVKLLIPEDAKRSSATGRKCRCDKAIVVAIETINGESSGLNEIASDYNSSFIYRIGETVIEPNFCEDRFKECAEGIHFFINRQEAANFN